MNDQDRATIIKTIKEYTIKHTKTPGMALAALVKEGIYTADGQLHPDFGGPLQTPKTKPKTKK
jgi:hypothetical protein